MNPAKAWKQRWQLVNDYEIEELRRLSPEDRLLVDYLRKRKTS